MISRHRHASGTQIILYIDDELDNLKRANGKIFADDTKLLARIRELLHHLQLQEDLNRIIFWSQQNNTELNGKKFEVMNYTLNSSSLIRTLPLTSQYYYYHTDRDEGTVMQSSETVRILVSCLTITHGKPTYDL